MKHITLIIRPFALGLAAVVASFAISGCTSLQTAPAPDKQPVWKKNPVPRNTNSFINSVDISADGQLVLAGNFYHNYGRYTPPVPNTYGVFLWNAAGNLLWSDTFLATEGTYWVALSRNAKTAAGGGLLASKTGFVNIYDVTTGSRLLSYTNIPSRVSRVALSGNGGYLAAGADKTYLFQRTGPDWQLPQTVACPAGCIVVSLDVSDDGQWIAVVSKFERDTPGQPDDASQPNGYVQLIQNVGGQLTEQGRWAIPNGGQAYWVDMAANGSGWAVGASQGFIYYFSPANFSSTHGPDWMRNLPGCKRCGCVAVSPDGSLVSAVGNTTNSTGKVFLLSNQGNGAEVLWSSPTLRDPNSTSLDAAGQYVTATDGYNSPGTLYLFNRSGTQLWNVPTLNMSWPMKISDNAAGIAAGSDGSHVYYFTPQ